jgi:hypothetical protein
VRALHKAVAASQRIMIKAVLNSLTTSIPKPWLVLLLDKQTSVCNFSDCMECRFALVRSIHLFIALRMNYASLQGGLGLNEL